MKNATEGKGRGARAWLRGNGIAVAALVVAIGGTATVAQAVNDNAQPAAKKKKAKRGPAGPQGPQGPAGPAGSDANLAKLGTAIERSSGNVNVANNSNSGGSANCLSGEIAVGGGANIQALPVGASLSASRRLDADSWTASVNNQSGGSVNLQVFVYCITP